MSCILVTIKTEYVLDYMLVCKFVYKIYYNVRGRSREKEKGKELHTRRIKNIAHLYRYDLKRCMLQFSLIQRDLMSEIIIQHTR